MAAGPTPKKSSWHEPFMRVLRALAELLAHLLVVICLLGGIRLLEAVTHRLWGSEEHVFFGRLKLRYIFDAADLAILVGFLVYGVYSVVAAYIRKP